jgi:tetratricopeptide (TPR) repeat protein
MVLSYVASMEETKWWRKRIMLISNFLLLVTAASVQQSEAYQSSLLPFRTTSTVSQNHDRNFHESKFDFAMNPRETTQMLLLSSTPKKHAFIPTKVTTVTSSLPHVRRRRSRGVLGFQITSTNPSNVEAPWSRQASVSNVDTMAWNLPQPLQSEDILPWIPSTEDIEKLTVVQLKKELGIRALKKVGNKYLLQNRLKEWTQDNKLEDECTTPPFKQEETLPLIDQEEDRLQVDSLQEWARTVDLEPLLQRREEIHREKRLGPKRISKRIPAQWPSNVRSVLQKMFDQPSSIYSNYEVQQMYTASKQADQMGNRALAKRILYELKSATPHDARIYRRVARMEMEENQIYIARSILQEGIDLHPDNAFLWHGLGQLEGHAGNFTAQRQHWEMAMQVDPFVPHSYHALATYDHAAGRIASAMKILKLGLQYCPTNHRLHHALGDLYRDAKLLKMAQKCYQKAIQHGPNVSHGFGWTALAYVAYEEGQLEHCRSYLHKALRDEGRCANAWVALAQFEECVGDIAAARSAAQSGIAQYEQRLMQQHNCTVPRDPVAVRNPLWRQRIPAFRSGDRFHNVYRNWLRLEMRYGSLKTVEDVYERAITAFPQEFKIRIDMAQHYQQLNLLNKARQVYASACGTTHAYPYRLRAELEMRQKNYGTAQKILYSGALTVSQSRGGVCELFYTWALCEWHLGHYSHTEKLLDYTIAAPWTESLPRTLIWYTRARMEWDRQEPSRAQHFIGLCLSEETTLPGGNGPVWDLWSDVAIAMGNARLAQQCQDHATLAYATNHDDSPIHLFDSRQWMRRDPWYSKIFTPPSGDHDLHRWTVFFPLPREYVPATDLALESGMEEHHETRAGCV